MELRIAHSPTSFKAQPSGCAFCVPHLLSYSHMPRLNLIAIGDATKDVFVNISEASLNCQINKEACQLCFNYAEKIPAKGVVQVAAAGNAANAAVGTCRLGHTSALVTWLGDDDDGHELTEALKCANIDRRFITFEQNKKTNYSTILNYEGERTILVYKEPRAYKLPPKLPAADWIYYTAIGEKHLSLEKSLLAYLKKCKTTKLLFNPGVTHLRRGLKALKPILKRTHTLILNKEEARQLLMDEEKHPVPSLLQRLQSEGPNVVIITDGKKGAWAIEGQRVWNLGIFPGDAIERTGAGDAFATGYVNAILAGKDVPEALRWGNANSQSVVLQIGPQAGLLTTKQMQSALKKYSKIKAKSVKTS
ncbi:hypothetical protein GF380_05150 [Candidatus Uhrbacteria bacterium]|nr:hypothetical protein [Candidatus Uhrbacteria bacterium]MBD3284418.1 hypothetical protein [Candidatus Uhrbacteria bacterium]